MPESDFFPVERGFQIRIICPEVPAGHAADVKPSHRTRCLKLSSRTCTLVAAAVKLAHLVAHVDFVHVCVCGLLRIDLQALHHTSLARVYACVRARVLVTLVYGRQWFGLTLGLGLNCSNVNNATMLVSDRGLTVVNFKLALRSRALGGGSLFCCAACLSRQTAASSPPLKSRYSTSYGCHTGTSFVVVNYCLNASQPNLLGIPQHAGDQNGARRWVQTGVYQQTSQDHQAKMLAACWEGS